MMADDNASLTEKWPALVSGAIGLALTNAVTFVVSVCDCLTPQQTAGLLALVNSAVAAAVMLWQFRNMWSKDSVAKVLDRHSPSLTTAQAKTIANEGGATS